MRKHYYAIEHAYGAETLNLDGNRANRLLHFASRTDRDEWIALGPEYPGESNYREAVGNRHHAVNRIVRVDSRYHFEPEIIEVGERLVTVGVVPYLDVPHHPQGGRPADEN